jgi:ABC-type transport system involved in multi-copper enzyme maturation permease subunit
MSAPQAALSLWMGFWCLLAQVSPTDPSSPTRLVEPEPAQAATATATAEVAPNQTGFAPVLPESTPIPQWMIVPLQWMIVWGDPNQTDSTYGIWFAHTMTWIKVLAWLSVLAWIVGRVADSVRQRRGVEWIDYGLIAGLILGLASIFVQTSFETGAIERQTLVGGLTASSLLGGLGIGLIGLWVEFTLWTTALRASERGWAIFSLIVLHLALGLGFVVAFLGSRLGYLLPIDIIPQGFRVGVTYMGLMLFVGVVLRVLDEVFRIRLARVTAIAGLTFREAARVMRAPYVLVAVFLVVLAFTHYFIQPPEELRAAELTRRYVTAIMVLVTFLVCMMVCIVLPLSLPRDIENQTVYTVVTKPVRRLEIIWGRVAGVMAVVTLVILFFGIVSGVYLNRVVSNAIDRTEREIATIQDTDPFKAEKLRDQVDELKVRSSARVPIKGSLRFTDSRGNKQVRGIDVGQEQEKRSHIEGATDAKAIWVFGDKLNDPIDEFRRDLLAKRGIDPARVPVRTISRPIPMNALLGGNTIEALEDRFYNQVREINQLEQQSRDRAATNPTEANRLRERANRLRGELDALIRQIKAIKAQDHELLTTAAQAEAAGDLAAADRLYNESARLHAPNLTFESTFIIYRTTKGLSSVGEAVLATFDIINPNRDPDAQAMIEPDDPSAKLRDRERVRPQQRLTLPILEYYTNDFEVPAGLLVGSGGNLIVEVMCVTPSQYLGVSESDLYIVQSRGGFTENFAKALFGIWLQALVITCVAVCVSSFLKWRVALLATVGFFLAGYLGFGVLTLFFEQNYLGGGPFESLVRLLTHQNQISDLAATPGVLTAKSLDAVFTPILATMAFVIPNFPALSTADLVAEGYAIGWDQLLLNTGLALAYALPFSILAYFIFNKREVAA